MTDHDWKWYSGSNDETFHNGPFDTREQAVAAVLPALRARTVAALRCSAGVSCVQWSRWEPRLRLSPHVPSPPRPTPCGSLTRVGAGRRVPINHGAAGTERVL